MKQYIFNVPDTNEAQSLLNLILTTGYFEKIEEFDSEEFEDKVLYSEMQKAKEEGLADKDSVLKKLEL